MNSIAIKCTNITKEFGAIKAVDHLDFAIPHGQIFSLLGPSGCGKTSALRLIAGFERPDEGEIWIGDKLVTGPSTFVPPERRGVGMVFQDYALFPHLTVAQNVAFGLHGFKDGDKQSRLKEVIHLARLDQMENRYPHQLSGGQQQRVALARALAAKPVAVFLDEPFSNLDTALRQELRQEVRDILSASETTAIFVTHDQEEALFMGDLVAVMNLGSIEQVDTPDEIFNAPASRFVALFMGTADFLPMVVNGEAVATEIGHGTRPPSLRPMDGLELMLRADDIAISPSEKGMGRIAGRVFQGAYYLYEVALPSGSVVHSMESHTLELTIGTRVDVSKVTDHPLLCFKDGRSTIDGAMHYCSDWHTHDPEYHAHEHSTDWHSHLEHHVSSRGD